MLTFVGGMVFCFVNLLFKGLGNELQVLTDWQTLGAYLLTQTAFDTFTGFAAGLCQGFVVEAGCVDIVHAGTLLFVIKSKVIRNGNVLGTVILAVSAGCAGDRGVRLNDGGGLHFLALDSASWDLHAPV